VFAVKVLSVGVFGGCAQKGKGMQETFLQKLQKGIDFFIEIEYLKSIVKRKC